MNLIRTFESAGWNVVFASAAKATDFSDGIVDSSNLTAKSTTRVEQIQLNDSRFEEWISQESPDFVIFDRFVTEEQLGWKVQKGSPHSVRLIDTQDLHFLRKARERHLRLGRSVSEVSQCEFDLKSGDDVCEKSRQSTEATAFF
jgi:hypothetical protein